MATPSLAVLDHSAAELVETVKQSQYWSYKEDRIVKLGLVDRFISWLMGDCLGIFDTRAQRCAFRTLEAIKRAAEKAPTSLCERLLVQEWHANTEKSNSWNTLLSLATSKKKSLYRNQLSRLFLPSHEIAEDPVTSKTAPRYIKQFNTLAPPLDKKSQTVLETFFVKLMEQGKKNSNFFLADKCKFAKIKFLGRYAWSMQHLITFTSYFPPNGILIAHPLRIMALCLLPGPILTAGLDLQQTRQDLWNVFFPKLVHTLNWYDPALFADPRLVNGLLLSLNIDPTSNLFRKCKQLVANIETDRRIHHTETELSKKLWLDLFTRLVERLV